jgi:hypothetical protein
LEKQIPENGLLTVFILPVFLLPPRSMKEIFFKKGPILSSDLLFCCGYSFTTIAKGTADIK